MKKVSKKQWESDNTEAGEKVVMKDNGTLVIMKNNNIVWQCPKS